MKMMRMLMTMMVVFTTMIAKGQVLTEEMMPDAETLPEVTPYFLQHQYLSVVVPMVKEGDGFIFSDPKILNTISAGMNGFRSPFRDDEITVDSVADGAKMIYVWQFPEPEYLREALYMAFVPVDGHYMAYAICIGQLVDWEISTSTQLSRETYGRVKRPASAHECVELLKERGAFTGKITMGEFMQEGYKSPDYRP